MTGIGHVVVAVPARDEEALIGECLTALARACELLSGERPGIGVDVVVALDACTDGTARIVARHSVRMVEISQRTVGAAREASVRDGLLRAAHAGHRPETVWVACTDADTVVPPDWLLRHVDLADRGADLVTGTAVPVEQGDDTDSRALAAWRARHGLVEGHGHVHGANLGVRASAYEDVGGFAAVALHEDVGLVERIRAAGWTCVATDSARVRTSARRANRVPGGLGGYLRELDGEAPSPFRDRPRNHGRTTGR